MQCFAGLKALDGSFRFPFVVYAQKIAGIIAEKIGRYTAGSFNWGRKENALGRENHFFTLGLLCLKGNYLLQDSGIINTQGVGYLDLCPAWWGNLPFICQCFVIIG